MIYSLNIMSQHQCTKIESLYISRDTSLIKLPIPRSLINAIGNVLQKFRKLRRFLYGKHINQALKITKTVKKLFQNKIKSYFGNS